MKYPLLFLLEVLKIFMFHKIVLSVGLQGKAYAYKFLKNGSPWDFLAFNLKVTLVQFYYFVSHIRLEWNKRLLKQLVLLNQPCWLKMSLILMKRLVTVNIGEKLTHVAKDIDEQWIFNYCSGDVESVTITTNGKLQVAKRIKVIIWTSRYFLCCFLGWLDVFFYNVWWG